MNRSYTTPRGTTLEEAEAFVAQAIARSPERDRTCPENARACFEHLLTMDPVDHLGVRATMEEILPMGPSAPAMGLGH